MSDLSRWQSRPGQQHGRRVPMRVIVCGAPRTGTLSMRHALWHLGFHDCHHMYDCFHGDVDHLDQWTAVFDIKYSGTSTTSGPAPVSLSRIPRSEWDVLLARYQACVDAPSTFFAAELAAAYPDAKVVVLRRDEDSWWRSMSGSIAQSMQPSTVELITTTLCGLVDPFTRARLRFTRAMGRAMQRPTGGSGLNREEGIAWFRSLYAGWERDIPQERRIDMTIKDGWGPLCKHLGVEVPTVLDVATGKQVPLPFPRTHDQEEFRAAHNRIFQTMVQRSTTRVLSWIGTASLIFVLGSYLAGFRGIDFRKGFHLLRKL